MANSLSTILVVEDCHETMRLLKRQLAFIGLAVMTAGDGEEARKLTSLFVPDLILLEGHLMIDGEFELREQLRAAVPEARVIYYTARVFNVREIEDIRGQGDDFLLKPVDMGDLEKMVARMLTSKSPGQ